MLEVGAFIWSFLLSFECDSNDFFKCFSFGFVCQWSRPKRSAAMFWRHQVRGAMWNTRIPGCGRLWPLILGSLINSRYFYSAFSSPLLLRGAFDNSIDTVSELTHWSATGNCEWSTCPRFLYVAARARFKPMTLWTKGDESTNEPWCPT